MENLLIPPAKAFLFFVPAIIFSLAIPIAGVAIFTYIMALGAAPQVKAAPDNRFDRIPQLQY
jgi:hypothetical protein